jgi:septum formation protein
LAESNALAKTRGAHLPEPNPGRFFVLGTDTVVAVGRRVLGKAADAQEAADMLRALEGREHRVLSGVALRLWDRGQSWREVSGLATTQVRFRPLSEAEVTAYLKSGEWEGKAGAYAIQGLAALFVEGIRGDYSNVVGLPLSLLADLFQELGFDLLRREWGPA